MTVSATQRNRVISHNHLPKAYKGAWAESIAQAWLIEKGYEVYVGIWSTSCDMIALKDGVMTRVEVKYIGVKEDWTGRTYLPIGRFDDTKYDLLLAVDGLGNIHINPEPQVLILNESSR